MTQNEQFFYDNAGYSYDPTKETIEQGKEFAKKLEWSFVWEYDQDGCIGCDCNEETCACSTGAEHEVLSCVLRGNDGDYADGRDGSVLASLGSICDPTRSYRRVIEAELASEAMTNELSIAKMMAS